MELLIIAPAMLAGCLVATYATVQCSARLAQTRRDRELFRAYLDDPRELEVWLLRGAVGEVQRTIHQAGNASPLL